MLHKLALLADQKADEEDLAGAIKYATLVNGECGIDYTFSDNLHL